MLFQTDSLSLSHASMGVSGNNATQKSPASFVNTNWYYGFWIPHKLSNTCVYKYAHTHIYIYMSIYMLAIDAKKSIKKSWRPQTDWGFVSKRSKVYLISKSSRDPKASAPVMSGTWWAKNRFGWLHLPISEVIDLKTSMFPWLVNIQLYGYTLKE